MKVILFKKNQKEYNILYYSNFLDRLYNEFSLDLLSTLSTIKYMPSLFP